MIFELKQNKSKFIEEAYSLSMKELRSFYEVDWVRNIPKVYILNSREDIDAVRGEKTERWVIGWVEGFNTLYLLNFLKIKTESSHKEGYSKREYAALIKHELSHLFFKILVKNGYRPIWLWEGVAIYTSEQNEFKTRPEKFSQFLDFYDKHKEGKRSVYYESGFFIELLIEKFGKTKFLNFLRSLQKIKNKKEFDSLFFKTFKFRLNYKEINKT
ncbi:MAG: hypothetical protein ACQEP6_03355 [Patescibacteria group bacterium]